MIRMFLCEFKLHILKSRSIPNFLYFSEYFYILKRMGLYLQMLIRHGSWGKFQSKIYKMHWRKQFGDPNGEHMD